MTHVTTHIKNHHDGHPSLTTLKHPRMHHVPALFFALLWAMFSGGLILFTEKTTAPDSAIALESEQNRIPPLMAWHPFLYNQP